MSNAVVKPTGCRLSAVVAMTDERVIGRAGALPWHLPEDLQFFKKTTLNHPILMGRGTFDSIGKALPKRQNIILTHDRSFRAAGCEIIHDLAELETLKLIDPKIFVLGGGQIYDLVLPILDELIVTHVHGNHAGDTFFPSFDDKFEIAETLHTQAHFHVMRYLPRFQKK